MSGTVLRALPILIWGFPGGTMIQNPPVNVGDARDLVSIPGSVRSPGTGDDNQLQYSSLENPMDREPGYSPWDPKESDATEHTHI